MLCHGLLPQFLILFTFIEVSIGKSSSNVMNIEVYSTVDLRNQFACVTDGILFVNEGPHVLTTYKYLVNEPELYVIEFYNEHKSKLQYVETKNSNITHFEIKLDREVAPNESYKILTKITYANKIKSAVMLRTIQQDQLMRFKKNLLFYSPYNTSLSRTDFWLKNDSLIETSKIPNHTLNDRIAFMYHDIVKYSIDNVELTFVNNDAFLVIKSLERTIDINHFGKIFIQDILQLQNIGPQLVGPYDPIEHEKASTSWLYTYLPASASNIRFFDILGNSSKTEIYDYEDYLTLKFKTRYPLLGGWKTSYVVQYEVPIHEYLFTSENYYYLQIRAIDYILDYAVIENADIKIILPEGGYLRNLHLKSKIKLIGEETACPTSLCIFGRKILLFQGRDLFENYITKVEIEYYWNTLYFLRAPIVIIVYLEIIFVGVISTKWLF